MAQAANTSFNASEEKVDLGEYWDGCRHATSDGVARTLPFVRWQFAFVALRFHRTPSLCLPTEEGNG